ncbi:autophagy related lipase [Saccharata proteae CBS 121410]|uniref:triacylglycerol lipase n=1 Tax=Saccharata proteae CBS 121410 TaxID=1314787 RepID=A0A9P4LYA9_9PEZI|nr:autophagy related lipase [Saccharata proteae CBS 121410]
MEGRHNWLRLFYSRAAPIIAAIIVFCIAIAEAGVEEQRPLLPVIPSTPAEESSSQVLDLRLRHVFHHGLYLHPDLHRRIDVGPQASVWLEEEDGSKRQTTLQTRVRAQPMAIHRLHNRSPARLDALMDEAQQFGERLSLPSSAWTVDEVPGPNVSDKDTVLSFARMASNSYIMEPNTGDWYDVGGGFNYTEDFGWEKDGLRGHIFADITNKTVVISLKGTTIPYLIDDPSSTKDKINDNLFFSCCCAQGGSVLWKQVCDCKTSTYTCNSACLKKALRRKNRYYSAGRDLYHNVSATYPNADIIFAGHSLGGAVSSLLGLTYGHPAITFESPGEAMVAARLGLPTPPAYHVGADGQRVSTGGFHFGNTADPIFMGTCNGLSATCPFKGFAFESVCHTGMTCEYDTVKDFGWHSFIGNHKITTVIDDVISKYDKPAECKIIDDCSDCPLWKYYEGDGPSSTTSSSATSIPSPTTSTATSTTTCKTPGWWGCRDSSTTSTAMTASTTATSTTTCKTPGWWGCRDASTTSTVMTTSTTTTTCHTPGWFGGCRDSTSTVDARVTSAPGL